MVLGMGQEQYKVIQSDALLSLLHKMDERLSRMEGRLAAIESQMNGVGPFPGSAMPAAASAPLPPSLHGPQANQNAQAIRTGVRQPESRLAAPAMGLAEGLSVMPSSTPTAYASRERAMMLAPADQQIVQMIGLRGAVCAEDVRSEFKYKGKNAASARLSRLFELGLLEKSQAGHTVYYRLRGDGQ